ncbi:hypothetical protein QF000_007930 [Paraburkholderia atlantica]|uniref:J domain-containing protein n=1 Tax=Paraburkholderia atlantica TaxID=2654982 RepID=UPI003D2217D8
MLDAFRRTRAGIRNRMQKIFTTTSEIPRNEPLHRYGFDYGAGPYSPNYAQQMRSPNVPMIAAMPLALGSISALAGIGMIGSSMLGMPGLGMGMLALPMMAMMGAFAIAWRSRGTAGFGGMGSLSGTYGNNDGYGAYGGFNSPAMGAGQSVPGYAHPLAQGPRQWRPAPGFGAGPVPPFQKRWSGWCAPDNVPPNPMASPPDMASSTTKRQGNSTESFGAKASRPTAFEQLGVVEGAAWRQVLGMDGRVLDNEVMAQVQTRKGIEQMRKKIEEAEFEVRKAHKKLLIRFHPDKHLDKDMSEVIGLISMAVNQSENEFRNARLWLDWQSRRVSA